GGVVDGDVQTPVGERLRPSPTGGLVTHEGRPFGLQLLDEQTILKLGQGAHQQFSNAPRSPALHDTLCYSPRPPAGQPRAACFLGYSGLTPWQSRDAAIRWSSSSTTSPSAARA